MREESCAFIHKLGVKGKDVKVGPSAYQEKGGLKQRLGSRDACAYEESSQNF